MKEDTPKNTVSAPEPPKGVSVAEKRKVWPWITLLTVLAILAGLFFAFRNRGEEPPVVEEQTSRFQCVDVRQWGQNQDAPWDGFRGTMPGRIGDFEDTIHLNIQVDPVTGRPMMETNRFPEPSQEAKDEFIKGKWHGIVGMITYVDNHYDILSQLGFTHQLQRTPDGRPDYRPYVERRENGYYYLNDLGCELAIQFAEVHDNEWLAERFADRDYTYMVEIRTIWIDQALARTLQNTSNTNGNVRYFPLTSHGNMTAWEIRYFRVYDSGQVVQIGTARQLTRCGNLTPERPPTTPPPTTTPPPRVPEQKPAPRVRPDGDGNFAGRPDNPGNPPTDVIPEVRFPVQPDIRPGDPLDPERERGNDGQPYRPPNPEIIVPQPTDPQLPPPVVIVPPPSEGPPASGLDPGGF